jgi:hypothetical protein
VALATFAEGALGADGVVRLQAPSTSVGKSKAASRKGNLGMGMRVRMVNERSMLEGAEEHVQQSTDWLL